MASLWMLVAGFMFACMGVLVKLAAAFFSNTELVFYRSLVGVITTFLVMRAYGMPLVTEHWKSHCWRGLSGLGGVLLFFYCILQLPLATAISLNNTWPLFLAFLAMILLKEEFSWLLAGALIVGFIGVIFLLRPTLAGGQWYLALIGIGSGLFAGIAHFHVRQLSELGESDWLTVFYFYTGHVRLPPAYGDIYRVSPVGLQSLTLALGIRGHGSSGAAGYSVLRTGEQYSHCRGVLSIVRCCSAGLMDLFFCDARLPVFCLAGGNGADHTGGDC